MKSGTILMKSDLVDIKSGLIGEKLVENLTFVEKTGKKSEYNPKEIVFVAKKTVGERFRLLTFFC